MLPESPLGLLTVPGWRGIFSRLLAAWTFPYQSLHPGLGEATARLIKSAHDRGRLVFVYTVNREEDMVRLFEAGVDGIFTDDPKHARVVLERIRPSNR